MRGAASDFYFNSWRLVPANVVWGVGLIALLVTLSVWPFGALLAAPLLALPTTGVFRLAALITRGEFASFRDALAVRRYVGPALATGVVATLVALVAAVNVINAVASGGALAAAMATGAAWGLLFFWTVGLCFWPLLVDPRRPELSVRARLVLAVSLVIAHPVKFGTLAVVVALLLIVSVIAFAALLTISVSFVALLASRYVLPAADRFEGRATEPVPA